MSPIQKHQNPLLTLQISIFTCFTLLLDWLLFQNCLHTKYTTKFVNFQIKEMRKCLFHWLAQIIWSHGEKCWILKKKTKTKKKHFDFFYLFHSELCCWIDSFHLLINCLCILISWDYLLFLNLWGQQLKQETQLCLNKDFSLILKTLNLIH